MIKKIEQYEQYKAILSKLNKARLKFENTQKLFEQSQKISDELSTTLGISKAGEQIDFDQINKAEQQTKIKSREMKLAGAEYLKAEEKVKETIKKIQKLRIKDAQKIGLRISKTIVKAINMLNESRAEYTTLSNEMRADYFDYFGREKGMKKKDFSSDIGPECRLMIGSPFLYKGFLRVQKEYQKRIKKY